MVKTGTVWSGLIVTNDATGALATPSVGPAGVLYVDGTANAASVTISGANPYKWQVTLPALTVGQCVSLYITATIATIATASVVAEDVADTVALSDVSTAVADVPTVTEFNARTLVAADYTVVSDLGTVQTGDAYARLTGTVEPAIADVPTVAEFNARTLVAANYFDPATDTVARVTLVDTTTTNTDMVAAAPTVSQIDTELTSSHGSGSWSSGSLGGGARTVLITVNNGADPLENAKIRLTQGVETYVGETDASGQVTFNVDDATWVVAITKAGYTYTGTTLVVDGDETPAYSMTAVSFSVSDPGKSTGWVYCYNYDGEIESAVTIQVQQTATPEIDSYAFDTTVYSGTSDEVGLVEFTGLWIGATYQARRASGAWHSFVVPNAASFALPVMLGR